MNGEVDEVGIDYDVIRRPQLHIVFKEQSNTFLLESFDLDLVNLSNLLYLLVFLRIIILCLVNLLALVTLLQARVLGVQHALHLRELSCLVCFAL